jgi:hypothetical protein
MPIVAGQLTIGVQRQPRPEKKAGEEVSLLRNARQAKVRKRQKAITPLIISQSEQPATMTHRITP